LEAVEGGLTSGVSKFPLWFFNRYSFPNGGNQLQAYMVTFILLELMHDFVPYDLKCLIS